MRITYLFFLLMTVYVAPAQSGVTIGRNIESKPDFSDPAFPPLSTAPCNSARFNAYSQLHCLQRQRDWLAVQGEALCNDAAAKACIENYHRVAPEAFWCRARSMPDSTSCSGNVTFYRANWIEVRDLINQNSTQCYNRYFVLDYDASSDAVRFQVASFDAARTCYSLVLMSAIVRRFANAERIDFVRGRIRYPNGCTGLTGIQPAILFRVKSGGAYYFYDLSDNPARKAVDAPSGCGDVAPRLWNPTRILVFLVFLVGLAIARKNSREGRWLLWILSASALHEAIAVILRYHGIENRIPTNIYVFVHGLLWLLLLKGFTPFRRLHTGIIIGYIVCCFLNFLCWEGIASFAFLNFVSGAILYTAMFLFTSFQLVRGNQFHFFGRPVFLLLLAPVPYYIGLSLMFGFMSKGLGDLCLYNSFTFYEAMCTLVNFLYYGLVLLYLYIDRKPRHNA